MTRTVYVVMLRGVHYRGIAGIYTDRQAASSAAAAVEDRSDGYHFVFVCEYPLNTDVAEPDALPLRPGPVYAPDALDFIPWPRTEETP